MGGKNGLKTIMPGNKAIGLMVVRGFGLDLTFTPVFDSKVYAFLICLSMTVVGGTLDFLTSEGLKALERQKQPGESMPQGEPAHG